MNRTVHYHLSGASFEWDPAKATANQLRHGISFELACEDFFDPFLRIVDAKKFMKPATRPLVTPRLNNYFSSYI